MRIYLDSRDLIVLAERQTDEYLRQIADSLRAHDATLVLSLTQIQECSVPLTKPGATTSVMRTLGRIESLPHTFIAEAKVHRDELISAIDAFKGAREYELIDPYVSRFDEVVSPFQPPATQQYLSYGLAQTVFELWTENPALFSHDTRSTNMLAKSREIDRARSDHKRHDLNFPEYVRRTLPQVPEVDKTLDIDALACWIWQKPSRCPTIRLGYEVYHQILRNVSDKSADGDMGDLSHITCLPYVDAMTLDRRIRGYVAQADKALNTQYSRHVYNDIEDLRVRCAL